MVSHTLLALACLWGQGQIDQGELNAMKAKAKEVLALAYSSEGRSLPSDILGPDDPRITTSPEHNITSFGYFRGSVAFYGRLNGSIGFQCSDHGVSTLSAAMTDEQIRQRAIAFARRFAPGKAFQIEMGQPGTSSEHGVSLRELKNGVPFFSGFWLQVNPWNGVITFGGIPARSPQIDRTQAPRVSKEAAMGMGLQKAIERDPELTFFEMIPVKTYWVVPEIEFSGNAPEHVKNAQREGKAIRMYLVGAKGKPSPDSPRHDRKVGTLWVDAETGMPISGRLMRVDGAGGPNTAEIKNVKRPEFVFIKKIWKPVSSSTLTKTAEAPQAPRILFKEGSLVVVGRADEKRNLGWIPSEDGWLQFSLR